MTRVISLILCFFLFCSVAMAEASNPSGDDFALDLDKPQELKLSRSSPTLSQDDSYSVTREDEIFTVNTGNITFKLDLTTFPTFFCLTQDIFASFDAYLLYQNPQSVQQWVIDNGIHFDLIDIETEMEIYIYDTSYNSTKDNSILMIVDNFSKLDSSTQARVASQICNNPIIKQAGDYSWILVNDNHLKTIFNNQYIMVQFDGSDPEADLADTLELLSHLHMD